MAHEEYNNLMRYFNYSGRFQHQVSFTTCIRQLRELAESGGINRPFPCFRFDGNKVHFVYGTKTRLRQYVKCSSNYPNLVLGWNDNSPNTYPGECYKKLYECFDLLFPDEDAFSTCPPTLNDVLNDFLPKLHSVNFKDDVLIPEVSVDGKFVHIISSSTIGSEWKVEHLLDLLYSGTIYYVQGNPDYPMFDRYSNYNKPSLFKLLIIFPQYWDLNANSFTDLPERIASQKVISQQSRLFWLKKFVKNWEVNNPEYYHAFNDFLKRSNLTLEKISRWSQVPVKIKDDKGVVSKIKKLENVESKNKEISQLLDKKLENVEFKNRETSQLLDKKSKTNLSTENRNRSSKWEVISVLSGNDDEDNSFFNSATSHTKEMTVESDDDEFSWMRGKMKKLTLKESSDPLRKDELIDASNNSDDDEFAWMRKKGKRAGAEKSLVIDSREIVDLESEEDEFSWMRKLKKVGKKQEIAETFYDTLSEVVESTPFQSPKSSPEGKEDREVDSVKIEISDPATTPSNKPVFVEEEFEYDDIPAYTEEQEAEIYKNILDDGDIQVEIPTENLDDSNDLMEDETKDPAESLPFKDLDKVLDKAEEYVESVLLASPKLTKQEKRNKNRNRYQSHKQKRVVRSLEKPSEPPSNVSNAFVPKSMFSSFLKFPIPSDFFGSSSKKVEEVPKTQLSTPDDSQEQVQDVTAESLTNRQIFQEEMKIFDDHSVPLSYYQNRKKLSVHSEGRISRTAQKRVGSTNSSNKSTSQSELDKEMKMRNLKVANLGGKMPKGYMHIQGGGKDFWSTSSIASAVYKREKSFDPVFIPFDNQCYALSLHKILSRVNISCYDIFEDGQQHDLLEYWNKLVMKSELNEFTVLKATLDICRKCKQSKVYLEVNFYVNTCEKLREELILTCDFCQSSSNHERKIFYYFSEYCLWINTQFMHQQLKTGRMPQQRVESKGYVLGEINYSGNMESGHYEIGLGNYAVLSVVDGNLPKIFFNFFLEGKDVLSAMKQSDFCPENLYKYLKY